MTQCQHCAVQACCTCFAVRDQRCACCAVCGQRYACCALQGTGPFGILTPADISTLLAGAQAAAGDTLPRMQRLLEQPGASELGKAMAGQLGKRFTARAIRLLNGVFPVPSLSENKSAGAKVESPGVMSMGAGRSANQVA